jgi:hypothetical protein
LFASILLHRTSYESRPSRPHSHLPVQSRAGQSPERACCTPRRAIRRSPSAPAVSCRPAARPSARALGKLETSSPHEVPIAWLAPDRLSNPRLVPACSSACAPPSSTCPRCSSSSTSARATSSNASYPAAPAPFPRSAAPTGPRTATSHPATSSPGSSLSSHRARARPRSSARPASH